MVCYKDIQFGQISIIKDLWEKNREYHENLSEHFGYLYSNLVFEERMGPFDSFDADSIKITIAENSLDKRVLGYCLSAIERNEGQTHSLHVAEYARGLGIGKRLMGDHINWMKSRGCENIVITVSYENINTVEFYKTLGFKENTIEMRIK